MIPDADTILAASEDALGVGKVDERAVRAAVHEARQLARWPADEVAAVFFAFARRPRAFPSHGRVMVAFLTRDQADRVGVQIAATDKQLDLLRGRVMRREVDYDLVLQWFAERMPVN